MIKYRRICWPEPDATCLNGGCGWCNGFPYRALTEIEEWAKTAGTRPHRGSGEEDALKAYQWGLKHQFVNADVRSTKPRHAE